jgi:hypothetical protein
MRPTFFPAALAAAVFLVPATGARADSGIGLAFGELSLGLDGAQHETSARALATGDFRISAWHGIQLDLGLSDRQGEAVGQIDAHLYMLPSEVTKYGFSLSVADVNDREATIGHVGIEGIFQLGENTFLTGQAALGYARPGSVDFIAGTVGLMQAVSDETSLFATLDLVEIDEAAMRTTAHTGRIGITWEPEGSALRVMAAVAQDALSGGVGAADDTWLELGVTWRFGAEGGARRPVAERAFRSWQPFDPLLRRGLF